MTAPMQEDKTTLDKDGLWDDDPGKMTVWSGLRVNPLTMMAGDVLIEDIAHSLSRQCRYNGHVQGFLSVARHCIWVSDRLRELTYPLGVQLQGLLHDAAEAYMGDMIRPLKMGPTGEAYLTAEVRLEAEIFEAFGLPFPLDPAVKEADNYVLLERELPRPNGARHTYWGTPVRDRDEFLVREERLQVETIRQVVLELLTVPGRHLASTVVVHREETLLFVG